MTYERFEDLPVWQAGMDLAVRVFALVEHRAFDGKGDVRNQMQRSSLSISQNIAEGFERGSTSELLMFLYIARGSAGETRSALRFCQLAPWTQPFRQEVDSLIEPALAVSRQLRGWTDSLQNSDIKGQRHLNDATRAEWDRARRTQAFMEKLQRIREGKEIPQPEP